MSETATKRSELTRYICRSRRYSAKVRWGNPCYPEYELTDDHGWLVAKACGSHFKVAAVRELFTRLVSEGFNSTADLDLSALTDGLDTETRR